MSFSSADESDALEGRATLHPISPGRAALHSISPERAALHAMDERVALHSGRAASHSISPKEVQAATHHSAEYVDFNTAEFCAFLLDSHRGVSQGT